jgi:hypothetical protein
MKFPEWLPVYGDTDYRGKCPAETLEQVTFFAELRRGYPTIGMIAIHPRNEGKRTYYQSSQQKAEGMTAGASDIVIPGNPSFVCELKRQDHTKCRWEPEQLDYLEAAKNNGCFVCVALGWESAFNALEEWLASTPK